MVQIAHINSLSIGRGRWTLKTHVIKDKKFRKYVMCTGKVAIKEIKSLKGPRNQERNPQTIYKKWKEDLLAMAKEQDKEMVPKYKVEKRNLESEKDWILSNEDLEEHDKRRAPYHVTKNLSTLEYKYHMLKREAVAMKNRMERETMCKYWTRTNKQALPRDLIYALKKPNPGTNETDSAKMAELGRSYHDNLQSQCHEVPLEIRRKDKESTKHD